MNRKEELLEIIKDMDSNRQILVRPTIDEIVYLEEEMEKLRKLQHIIVHPKDPNKQKMTVAGKLYHDYSAQKDNKLRILNSFLSKEGSEEIDPVQMFLEGRI